MAATVLLWYEGDAQQKETLHQFNITVAGPQIVRILTLIPKIIVCRTVCQPRDKMGRLSMSRNVSVSRTFQSERVCGCQAPTSLPWRLNIGCMTWPMGEHEPLWSTVHDMPQMAACINLTSLSSS